ncbi:MAG TPA: sigma-54 dependent transcriptional regulator, partial [Burkholderiales bacterium]|nr:sigma-54 dependent transcriptional regulator [Burkholderiales bacterium]
MTRVTVANLIGRSAAFQDTVRLIQRIALTDAPVLIEGETGTGKEVAARAIHYSGSRRDRPFVPVNCGAIPENLIENELFGHVRGAYTDAREPQPGLIALANGGTLFLDEVETLCPKGQVALLRFLQDLNYRPLGSRREESADVRVIAATNIDLAELVHAKQFRMDLYYRLQILFLRLPPLRERAGDAGLLAEHFVRAFGVRYGGAAARFSPDSLSLLDRYAWPGNVRELENLVHRAFLLTGGEVISIPGDWLTGERRVASPGTPYESFPLDLAFSEAKARLIDQFERV